MQSRHLLWQPEAQQLLRESLLPSTLIILVSPWQAPSETCPDDGTRLRMDPSALQSLHKAFGAALHHVPHMVLGPGSVDNRACQVDEMVRQARQRAAGISPVLLANGLPGPGKVALRKVGLP